MERRVCSNPQEHPNLVRLSVGLEDFVDLQADLIEAMLKARKHVQSS